MAGPSLMKHEETHSDKTLQHEDVPRQVTQLHGGGGWMRGTGE